MPTQRAELFAAIRAETDTITAAEALRLVAIAVACDNYSGLDTHTDELGARVLHGEQFVFPGGDGTPGITEFFHLELALSLGCSPETAQVWTADVLNLRHRHPMLWDATVAGDIPVWVARKVSRAALQLSFTQAREFDSYWALRLVSMPPQRAISTTETQVARILNDDKEAERQSAKKQRRVEFSPGRNTPGITDPFATMDSADAKHLSGTLDRLADVLKAGGSTASRDELRAEALGHLAHPDRARQLLQPSLLDGATVTPQGDVVNREGEIVTTKEGRCQHGAELILHLHASDLAESRGGEGEALGPVTLQHLKELLERCAGKVTVKPVIDLAAPVMVNVYRPGDELAQRVKLRDRYVMFPHSNRSAFGRGIDLDHTTPWPHGSTSTNNLGPLNRPPHRARTHAGFKVDQPEPGVFHWKSPAGQEAWVTHHGTWQQPPPQDLINDPAAGASRYEQLLRETSAMGKPNSRRSRPKPNKPPTKPANASDSAVPEKPTPPRATPDCPGTGSGREAEQGEAEEETTTGPSGMPACPDSQPRQQTRRTSTLLRPTGPWHRLADRTQPRAGFHASHLGFDSQARSTGLTRREDQTGS